MPSLDELSRPSIAGDQFAFDVPGDWKQGRGLFGGLGIAAMIRAIETRVADPSRKVRTVTAELAGPVLSGASEISVEILRAGNSVTVARAVLSQEDGVKTHVVAVLAASRKATTDGWQKLEPPTVKPWAELAPIVWSPAFPEFAQHMEYRLAQGVPGTQQEPTCIGYVRPRDPGEARDAAYIAALADAWWPAALVAFKAMRPIATITFTLEIVNDLDGLPADEPLLYRGTVPVMHDGYFQEERELWGSDGRLVARNHQTFAVIA
ncbi:MAG TPA: thioesterase family protein [Kofleriaceae bacterium]|jgi:acyl-CoA thioesterase